MKITKANKYNLYWFFRSLAFSAVIVFCIMALFFGILHCSAVMQKTVTGKQAEDPLNVFRNYIKIQEANK